jgi:tRNA pseudouridine38-40 synthase
MRVAVKFAYDGRGFSGYARQPDRKTVEGDLLQLLSDWGAIESLQEARFRAGSRTDRGVSALGNVVAFSSKLSVDDLRSQMPGAVPGIVVYGVREVEESFYPRYAMQRQYRYYLRTEGLDCNAIRDAAGVFLGEHDFRNFAKLEEGKDPVRCLDALTLSESGRFLVLDFVAQTFLWHQVRRMVAGLIRVGFRKLLKEDLIGALAHPEVRVDFGLAPAEPLILREVVYPFTFETLPGSEKMLVRLEEEIVSRL